MRLAALSALTLLLTSTAVAQLTPGYVVRSGEPFPIVADFNGDGLDDLIQERNVILNNGTSLSEVHDLGLPALEKVIGVLDVNGDHRLDLLTMTQAIMVPPSIDPNARPGDPVYRVYIADAQRHYGNPIIVASGPQLYVADANGDGRDDLFTFADVRNGVRSVATDVTIALSNGDGTFQKLPPFRINGTPQIWAPDYRVLAGDLNHDGITDLVIRCPDDLHVLRGLGNGRFAVESRYVPMDIDYGWWSNRLADVDGDGNLDVILAGMRNVRVFFGDGHGNFPRSTRVAIPKLHDASVPPQFTFLRVDEQNQPRDLAIGHFTRADELQIAAGTGEGDIVILGWQQGVLKEVSRTATEFWLLTVRPGTFHSGGLDDVYAMGTLIWGDVYPPPHVFNGVAGNGAAETVLAMPMRGRASRPATTAHDTTMQLHISGDCVSEAGEHWSFAREGIFGVAQQGQTKIETVFDGSKIYFRVTAPYTVEGAKGTLTESNGTYSGTADVLTPCGWKKLNVTGKME